MPWNRMRETRAVRERIAVAAERFLDMDQYGARKDLPRAETAGSFYQDSGFKKPRKPSIFLSRLPPQASMQRAQLVQSRSPPSVLN